MAGQKRYICVHSHFYQPARGNPLSDEPLREPTAAPFENWNERVTAECYTPNAEIGNLELISFNIGETLASWLAENAPDTYQAFIQADRKNVEKHGVGTAIAQGMHHTVLPLDRREDKHTQVQWGKAVFANRFGRQPEGMWLPEMAVDLETLEVLVDNGIDWTILTESQVIGKPAGAGPFWVDLPNRKRIKVFVRDQGLSDDIAFNLGNFGGAGRWAREVLTQRRRYAGLLTLIAVDGETFGHHWSGEEQFLHWLLTYEAQAAGYEVVTLSQFARMLEPIYTIRIRENTAWSSSHGLARWATGSPDTQGSSYWKGALRRALDNLRWRVDDVYRREAESIGVEEPLQLRDAYIRVVLGYVKPSEFLRSQEVDVNGGDAKRLLQLVEAQYFRQRMYTSCAFFFDDLDDLSTRYGIASAAEAIRLTEEASGVDLSEDFRRDLSIAVDHTAESSDITGADIYDEVRAEITGSA
ncbi:MAG: DUF3536 domain-containing protein [Chloroflexi bacterium]|nr:DUF3536 domain-containing protein [Chloroflexota bacterium]